MDGAKFGEDGDEDLMLSAMPLWYRDTVTLTSLGNASIWLDWAIIASTFWEKRKDIRKQKKREGRCSVKKLVETVVGHI